MRTASAWRLGAKAHPDMITLTLRSQLLSSQRLILLDRFGIEGNLCSLSRSAWFAV